MAHETIATVRLEPSDSSEAILSHENSDGRKKGAIKPLKSILHSLQYRRPTCSGSIKQSIRTHSSALEHTSTFKKPDAQSQNHQSHLLRAWNRVLTRSEPPVKAQGRRRPHRMFKPFNRKSTLPGTISSTPDVGESEALTTTNDLISKLGKSELGKHYDENNMPAWLANLLEDEKGVCHQDIIPVLHQLLEYNASTASAYICSPHVQHISKLKFEGGFCGYRNIQMLISYIIASDAPGSEIFLDSLPSIFHIQDLIEHAWDSGFNTRGRIETGGIKGTRKYIGTPEAQALFSSLGILCPVQAIQDENHHKARISLLCVVEAYFKQGIRDVESRIHATALPPIYFQHRGHSLTIVGLERENNGHMNLLVFDPSHCDRPIIREMTRKSFQLPKSKANAILEPYRRGTKYLRKYGEFELL